MRLAPQGGMRTNTSPSLVSLGLLSAALLGCGGVDAIPIDKTAKDFADAICPKAYSCCTADQLVNNDAAGTSEAECKTLTAENFTNFLQGLQNSQSAKRSKYERAKVDACLQTIRSSDCATLNMTHHLSGVPGCDKFATPLVSVGGRCDNDYECIDSYCKFPEDPDPPGPGVCTAGAATGQSCTTSQCAAGLTCDPVVVNDASDDICVAPAANGATCADGYQCASGVCSSGGSGGDMTCVADTSAKCFYSTGCSVAGGAPGLVALMLFGGLAAISVARKRRPRR
jgi:hypothetical protein